MPDFHISPISIVNQIKSNLQDRYDSGYPILKELLQNADDAEARRFRLDALSGWSTAANPLLRGPGLLVANDGFFRKGDESGIISFGESSKAADSAAIGKFGFGQKAVFHLCDAFVVYAQRASDRPFSTVVNPFLEVKLAGNISRQWEPPADGLDPADLEFLRREISSDFPDGHLVLWLPLRREGIQPAPGVGFSGTIPSVAATISELNRPDDLRAVLTALRHLKSIEIRERRELRCALELDDTQGRFLGPSRLKHGVRLFGGTIGAPAGGSIAPFVGREAMIPDGRLASLKQTQYWPQTITVLRPEPVPEKGEPHGAATLLRIHQSAIGRAASAQLRISWAVFLPVSDASDIVVPIDDRTLGQFHLLLHGYFFLDSGRRQIEGLEGPLETDEPADASALRRAWNGELRDSVVLPLIPSLLRDALDSEMLTSAELVHLVSALARHEWFRRNREAICREHALTRVVELPGGVVWRVVSSEDALRPVPALVANAPQRIEELLGTISTWAMASGARLVVGDSAALTPRPLRWTEADLGAVFSALSPRGFQARDLAQLLVDFLGMVVFGDTERLAIGPHIVAALRKAMTQTMALAPSELVKSALAHVPEGLLFPLPTSVENRQVLRALASVSTSVLPVRGEWLDDNRGPAQLANSDLKMLLAALEPLIESDHTDQAAIAALALLTRAGPNMSELARDPEFASIKMLRGRDVRARGSVVLSLQTLVDRCRAGLLFANSPQANSWLPLLVDALPNASPLIVEGGTMQFLRGMGGATLALQLAGKDSAFALINKSVKFGSESARQQLLAKLGIDAEDDPAPARRLCAGTLEAGYSAAKLWTLDTDQQRIERIVSALIERSPNEFLVPASIADGLSRTQRNHLRLAMLDAASLETLFDKNIAAIEQLAPTVSEREAIVETDLADDLLIRLPIHERLDGTLGDGRNVFRTTEEWSVPEALQSVVPIVRTCRSRKARERQAQLIEAWSPRRQIEVALAQAESHRFRDEILYALAKLTSPPEERLLEALRAKPWLLADGQPVKPQDVLSLPSKVDEAARTLLLKSGESPPFLPVAKLAIDLREHQGFDHLEKWVLPDRRSSFEALALMVEDTMIVGRLGAAHDYPIEDFVTLANEGAALGLPGWPLLAAILTSPEDSGDDTTKIVAAFRGLDTSDTELAGAHLNCLAALARENGRRGEAARRAYRHGFSVVAGWPEHARQQVFAGTRVPTEAGSWRSGREVVQDGDGLELGRVLARDYSSILGRPKPRYAESLQAQNKLPDPFAANRRPGEIRDVDLAALEAQSADQQRLFLDTWKGRVPSDLAIVYLGLIGRGEPFRRLASEWAIDATADIDTLWADLDHRFPKEILYPNPLAVEVDQRPAAKGSIFKNAARCWSTRICPGIPCAFIRGSGVCLATARRGRSQSTFCEIHKLLRLVSGTFSTRSWSEFRPLSHQ